MLPYCSNNMLKPNGAVDDDIWLKDEWISGEVKTNHLTCVAPVYTGISCFERPEASQLLNYILCLMGNNELI